MDTIIIYNPAPGPASGGEVFSDDFSTYTTGIDLDTEAAYSSGPGYTASTGGIRDIIVSASDTVYCDDATFKYQALRRETSLTSVDHYVEGTAQFTTSSTSNTRLALLVGNDGTSTTQGYVAWFRGDGSISIYLDNDGSTELATGTFTVTEGSDQTFRLERDQTSSTVVAKVGGTTVATASSETTRTGGQYGGFGQFEGVAVGQSYWVDIAGGTL